MDEQKCVCREWASTVKYDDLLEEMAVTFTCATHGLVTLDNRPVPSPRVIYQAVPGPPAGPPIHGTHVVNRRGNLK